MTALPWAAHSSLVTNRDSVDDCHLFGLLKATNSLFGMEQTVTTEAMAMLSDKLYTTIVAIGEPDFWIHKEKRKIEE